MVRNITGTLYPAAGSLSDISASGALYAEQGSAGAKFATGSYKWATERFSASRVVSTANENRPVNISAIPLIVAA